MSTPQPNPEPDAEALQELRAEVRASIERTNELLRKIECLLDGKPLADSFDEPKRRPPGQRPTATQ